MNFSKISPALFLLLSLLAVLYGEDSPPDPCGKFNSNCGECVQYKPIIDGSVCYYCTVAVQSAGPACSLDSAKCNVTAGRIANNTDQCSGISVSDTGGTPQPNGGNNTQPMNREESSTTSPPNPTTSNISSPMPTSTTTVNTTTTTASTVPTTTASNATLPTSTTPVTNTSSSTTPSSNSSTLTTLPSGNSTSTLPSTTLPSNVTAVTPNATTSITNVTSSTSAQSSESPSEKPETALPAPHRQHFDVASFVGGIVLALGIIAISFFGFKFYKSRTERNYQNFDNYI